MKEKVKTSKRRRRHEGEGEDIKRRRRHEGEGEGEDMKETHYAAESLSWYSLDLEKQCCTPGSFHSLFITEDKSMDISPSSALPARANNCLASSYNTALCIFSTSNLWNTQL
ncbi:hypothetical protein EB796_016640 [Bugula neritina]|uniref:Uncharacterized protein n=1 Tax=Bugula neritina TaxID=10212 RepID=A0A7J7JGY4_BUGNE|nr:hypothetical protein EB796_016640 [Bugula neritina]